MDNQIMLSHECEQHSTVDLTSANDPINSANHASFAEEEIMSMVACPERKSRTSVKAGGPADTENALPQDRLGPSTVVDEEEKQSLIERSKQVFRESKEKILASKRRGNTSDVDDVIAAGGIETQQRNDEVKGKVMGKNARTVSPNEEFSDESLPNKNNHLADANKGKMPLACQFTLVLAAVFGLAYILLSAGGYLKHGKEASQKNAGTCESSESARAHDIKPRAKTPTLKSGHLEHDYLQSLVTEIEDKNRQYSVANAKEETGEPLADDEELQDTTTTTSTTTATFFEMPTSMEVTVSEEEAGDSSMPKAVPALELPGTHIANSNQRAATASAASLSDGEMKKEQASESTTVSEENSSDTSLTTSEEESEERKDGAAKAGFLKMLMLPLIFSKIAEKMRGCAQKEEPPRPHPMSMMHHLHPHHSRHMIVHAGGGPKQLALIRVGESSPVLSSSPFGGMSMMTSRSVQSQPLPNGMTQRWETITAGGMKKQIITVSDENGKEVQRQVIGSPAALPMGRPGVVVRPHQRLNRIVVRLGGTSPS